MGCIPNKNGLSIDFTGQQSRTKQSFREECDIKSIIEKHRDTGYVNVNKKRPLYGDFTKVGDFQSSMDAVVKAQEAFDALPAKIRERFSHNPVNMVNFLSDESNYDEAVKLGLVEKKVVVTTKPADGSTSAGASTPALGGTVAVPDASAGVS